MIRKYYYWVLEFTNDRSKVMTDWFKATSADNAARQATKEHSGIVYSVDGPFESVNAAERFITMALYTNRIEG